MMTADLITDEALQRGVPLHRAGTIEDIAGLTLFLASKVRSFLPPFRWAILTSIHLVR